MRLSYTSLSKSPSALAFLRSGVAFSPLFIFTASEPGIWLDPSDITTLYQDAAGTTPVTAPGDPVALVLDKSKGLVLGPATSVTGWTNVGWDTFSSTGGSFTASKDIAGGTDNCYSSNTVSATLGQFYEITLEVASNTFSAFSVSLSATTNSRSTAATITGSGTKKALVQANVGNGSFNILVSTTVVGAVTISSISVKELPGFHAVQAGVSTLRPTFQVEYNGTGPLGSELVTNGGFATDTSGWTLAAGGSATVSGGVVTLTNVSSRARLSQFITTVSGRSYNIVVSGVGLGNSPTSSARVQMGSSQYALTAGLNSIVHVAAGASTEVVLFQNETTAGFFFTVDNISVKELPAESWRPYLKFDGVDDFLVTPTITPGIDKAQAFAGVRKLSDATAAIVVESSASTGANAGSFYLAAPEDLSIRYSSLSRGSLSASIGMRSDVTTGSAPDTAVLAVTHDIAGDISIIRRNTTAGTSAVGDKGTGNFLAYPLYIGRRGGTTLPFNGQLYSLIVRFGTNLDAGTITSTETWVNGKTGAY